MQRQKSFLSFLVLIHFPGVPAYPGQFPRFLLRINIHRSEVEGSPHCFAGLLPLSKAVSKARQYPPGKHGDGQRQQAQDARLPGGGGISSRESKNAMHFLENEETHGDAKISTVQKYRTLIRLTIGAYEPSMLIMPAPVFHSTTHQIKTILPDG